MSDPETQTAPSLEQRYADVTGAIAEAAARSGRPADHVMLVAVTKYANPEAIMRLMELGHRDFGENRVQQLVQRAGMSMEWQTRAGILQRTGLERTTVAFGPGRGVRWHMIGHVQRNKARKVAELCRLVHSVDSLRVAEELQESLARTDRVLDVLIQVDCSGEEAKHGCPLPAAMPMAEQIEGMYSLRVRGLMTIAPYSDDPEEARPVFARCRELFMEIRELGLAGGRFDLLSMGMTGDYAVAIEEGSNVVRVGSALFGPPPQGYVESEGDDAAEAEGDDDLKPEADRGDGPV